MRIARCWSPESEQPQPLREALHGDDDREAEDRKATSTDEREATLPAHWRALRPPGERVRSPDRRCAGRGEVAAAGASLFEPHGHATQIGER
jgi:hypothetical protein